MFKKTLQGLFISTVLLSQSLWAAALENPPAGSVQSGIGLISGWVCSAQEVTIEIVGLTTLEAAYGTARADTSAACGDTDNGFGLLLNYNLLGNGQHTIRALADGVEIAPPVTITVQTLGAEFLPGLQGTYVLDDFPTTGQDVVVAWQESKQNFSIVEVLADTASLNGRYALDRLSLDFKGNNNGILDTLDAALAATGEMVINGNTISQIFGMTNDGNSVFNGTLSGTFQDGQYFLRVSTSQSQSDIVLVERGNRMIMELHNRSVDLDVAVIQYWTKIAEVTPTATAADAVSPQAAPARIPGDILDGAGHEALKYLGY